MLFIYLRHVSGLRHHITHHTRHIVTPHSAQSGLAVVLGLSQGLDTLPVPGGEDRVPQGNTVIRPQRGVRPSISTLVFSYQCSMLPFILTLVEFQNKILSILEIFLCL